MYTTKPIRLHSKCLVILELIQKCNNRINVFESDLYHYDNAKSDFEMIRLMHRRESFTDSISRYKELKVYLVMKYQKVMIELMPPENVVAERYGNGINEYLKPIK